MRRCCAGRGACSRRWWLLPLAACLSGISACENGAYLEVALSICLRERCPVGCCSKRAESEAAVKTPANYVQLQCRHKRVLVQLRVRLQCWHKRVREMCPVGSCFEVVVQLQRWHKRVLVQLRVWLQGWHKCVREMRPIGSCFECAVGLAAVKTFAQRFQPQCWHNCVRERGPVGGRLSLLR